MMGGQQWGNTCLCDEGLEKGGKTKKNG
jgi:hypothetical protein